jgi:hypothetical protein
MRIKSSSESLGANGIRSWTSARERRVKQDPPSLAASEKLNQAFEQTTTVRPERVARAKALLADGIYPSEATLGKVADLLAKHLGTSNGA